MLLIIVFTESPKTSGRVNTPATRNNKPADANSLKACGHVCLYLANSAKATTTNIATAKFTVATSKNAI
ncbi:MAG: hypothetical protein QW818_03695 [Candidatus Aenigmatarchaeota archaeon]